MFSRGPIKLTPKDVHTELSRTFLQVGAPKNEEQERKGEHPKNQNQEVCNFKLVWEGATE